MRNVFSLVIKSLIIGALGSLLFGCKKDDTEKAQPKTVADLIKEDSKFSIFQAALTRANLSDALKATNLTVFVPDDAAFQAAGYANAAAVSALPITTAETIVNYHILNGKVAIADIPAGTNTSVQTKGGQSAYITKTTSGSVATVSINGAKVTLADVQGANGIVHVIDRLLVPPASSMLATIQADPANFSLVLAAVNRAATVNPTLALVLGGTSGSTQLLTVFLPDNAALTAYGLKDLATINAANPTTLSGVLSYHVTTGLLFSSQLQAGQLATLNGTNRVTIAVNTSGVATVKGNKNTSASTIKRANILTTNGIIHVIDQVLIP